MTLKAFKKACEWFSLSRQAITPARCSRLMIGGMMAGRSSVIGLMMEFRPELSFSRILCIDFDRPTRLESPKWRCTNFSSKSNCIIHKASFCSLVRLMGHQCKIDHNRVLSLSERIKYGNRAFTKHNSRYNSRYGHNANLTRIS